MADLPVQCGDCGAHFGLDPAGDVQGTACSECGGTRFFRNQPSPTRSDGTLRDMVDSDTQKDMGGNPLGEGTIMGNDGERPAGKRDNYMHSKTAYTEQLSHRDMRPETLNMEPYATLWSDDWLGKQAAGILGDIEGVLPEIGEGALDAGTALVAPEAVPEEIAAETAGDTASAAPSLMNRVLNGAQGVGQNPAVKGLSGADSAEKAEQFLTGGPGGGGSQYAGPMPPSPAPTMPMLGSTDLPWLLLADLETPHSVKSIDEQHDDPEKQDQKEFNDGDKSPSNPQNPNNEDSGASGEDGVRQDTPGYGFGPNSPGIERMETLMPILMHYLTTGQSGADDPMVQALHEALEQEQPGYLQNEHPDGQNMVEMLMQKHKSPHGVHAKTADALPSGLPAVPTPMGLGQNPGGGICPMCGGTLAADGSCPQCGAKAHPQGGMTNQQQMGGPSYAPDHMGRVANHQGPVTPEQFDAARQYLESKGQSNLMQDVLQHPEDYGWLMSEIQNQPNVAPLVDPSQAQPAPMPPPPGGQPGAMPMPDPSQPGGGMSQPMQPMSHTADANNAVSRCPECRSATTSIEGLGDNTGDGSVAFAKCHSCGHSWSPKISMFRLVAMPNPVITPAADQNLGRPNEDQNSTLIWKDSSGSPLIEGQTYSMASPNYPVPEEVEVVSKLPDALGVRLVGTFGSNPQNPGTPEEPDFTITPESLQMNSYTFEPANQVGQTLPPSGTPGLEHIPNTDPTTDEISDSYPNPGTTSSMNEDLCHKCGGTWIEHTASSATRTMHECARCGTAWETQDEDFTHESSFDLGWLYEDSYDDGFFSAMERAQNMREAAGGSRDLSSIAAKDPRLNRIRDVLATNEQERNQHLAGRHFTPSEQRALINERGTARNADLLDLSNTHYESHMGYDPRDPKGRANGLNAPDAHVVFGR